MWLLRALLVGLALPAAADVVVYPAPDGGTRELVVYSSLDSPLARPLIEAFQAIRPDVAVRYEDLLTGEIADRVIEETDAGAATADLIFSSAMDVTVKLANDGYAREAEVPGATAWPGWAVWRNMVFALTFEPAVIVYHKPSFPDGPPDTRAALIDWLATAPKGSIGTYDITRSAVGYLFLMRDQEHFADLWPLVRAMGRAGVQVFPTSQDVIERVNAGTLLLGYNVLGSYAADQVAKLPDLGMVLPQDYVVAHKTGSGFTTPEGVITAVNDVGIIVLPNGRKMAVSVFVMDSKDSAPACEKVIASMARWLCTEWQAAAAK